MFTLYTSRMISLALDHSVLQEVHLTPRVAVDDGLRDGQGLVEVAQRVHLPLLLLDGHIELTDTSQRCKGTEARHATVDLATVRSYV